MNVLDPRPADEMFIVDVPAFNTTFAEGVNALQVTVDAPRVITVPTEPLVENVPQVTVLPLVSNSAPGVIALVLPIVIDEELLFSASCSVYLPPPANVIVDASATPLVVME